ncbi:MAG: PSD1 and planctomycete cytochrome C domain-containing protein [Planctomycetota bacterium]|nr:PSD1 and planctomycete cytochrome C domain-containing protein [Planctomycetota bacterium]
MILCKKAISSLLVLLVAFGLCANSSDAYTYDDLKDEQDAQARFFETKVRPLLIDSCVRCHGDEKQEGGLRLDSQEAFNKGGESGSVIDTASMENSLFLSAIRYKDLEMPPSGQLSEEKIQILEQWVAGGSYWPAKTESLTAKRKGEKGFTDEDRSYWFFQPMSKHETVRTRNDSVSDRLDAFVEAGLSTHQLTFAEPATPLALVRRTYLDLIGVTPTSAEVATFLADPTDTAYASLVDRLLDDPRYGERWGRFWLDLVRFAESDGYKQDDFRPTAYRYRDYVVRSFNEDKPYRDFVREQLAGDEIDSDSLECRDASGYLRLWIYEYNQRDVTGQWNAILNDLTDVTGEAFMGLGYGCARCHDHKFDPLLQKDYFRLQAYFSGLIPREDLPAATQEQVERNEADVASWEEAAKPFLDTIEAIEAPIREKTIRSAVSKFPPDVRPALLKSAEQRSTREKQLAHLAYLQQLRDVKEIKWEKVLKGEQQKEWLLAKEYLKQLPAPKPKTLPVSLTATDAGPEPAEVYIPGKPGLGPISPGIPSIINPEAMPVQPMADHNSSGRRLALANWMVDRENPFTWRVIVNRVWQQHFGQGIVPNASDFGRLTETPTHPELLDFLASHFAENSGRMKSLHRWILNSRTYRQSAYPASTTAAIQIDPSNKWLWRFAPRRLDAEQLRDSMLTVAGELRPIHSGVSEDPNKPVRSIFVRSMRNSQDRFLALFDAPDGSSSTAKRNATTTPLQSLMMMNSDWVNTRAENMAKQIISKKSTPEACIQEAFERVFLKSPSPSDRESAKAFLGVSETANPPGWDKLFADYCHVLINSNSFLHME